MISPIVPLSFGIIGLVVAQSARAYCALLLQETHHLCLALVQIKRTLPVACIVCRSSISDQQLVGGSPLRVPACHGCAGGMANVFVVEQPQQW